MQRHESLSKILDFTIKKQKKNTRVQESSKNKGSAFRKQNELMKLSLP
jgi:hypothetical protein